MAGCREELVWCAVFDGPLSGRGAWVRLDEDANRPAELDQSWLWTEYGSELLDADVDGI